jgi:NO-binding membrane sensor protein with MHYT domain
MHHSSHWFVHAHDLRLVVVAALVCSLAAFTVFTILERTRLGFRPSIGWIAMAGLVCGVGTWATHFIAMLSYDPGVPAQYDLSLTLLSVLAAVLITGTGWRFALLTSRRSAVIGGLLIAGGISTMHYTGMAALRVSAKIVWSPSIVLLSVAACALFSIWSVFEHRRQRAMIPWRATIVLILAICTLHFTAMAAVSVVPNAHIEAPGAALDRDGLVALVLAGSLLVVAIGFFVVLFDRVTEREKAAAKIAHLAYHDALTGLSNRSVLDTHLSQTLEEAQSTGEQLAAICIDLAFEMGPVNGMSPKEIKKYIRYIADWRLGQLGFAPIYMVDEHPLPWLAPLLNGVEHANFFETRATEYSKAATRGDWNSVWDAFDRRQKAKSDAAANDGAAGGEGPDMFEAAGVAAE